MPALLLSDSGRPKLIYVGDRVGRRFPIDHLGELRLVQPAPYAVSLQLFSIRHLFEHGFVGNVEIPAREMAATSPTRIPRWNSGRKTIWHIAEGGFVDLFDIAGSGGYETNALKLVSRLNQQAGSLVTASHGQRRLVYSTGNVLVERSVLGLAEGLVDARILDLLAFALAMDVTSVSQSRH